MELFDDHIDYGLGMYKYSIWFVAGVIFAMAGPTALNMVLGDYLSGRAYTIVLFGGVLLSQVAGAVIAGAGFFGGLHRVLEDAS